MIQIITSYQLVVIRLPRGHSNFDNQLRFRFGLREASEIIEAERSAYTLHKYLARGTKGKEKRHLLNYELSRKSKEKKLRM